MSFLSVAWEINNYIRAFCSGRQRFLKGIPHSFFFIRHRSLSVSLTLGLCLFLPFFYQHNKVLIWISVIRVTQRITAIL